ncbi:MAG: T9SS type A sorting domain-containing protein [Bacteroidia bacterium]
MKICRRTLSTMIVMILGIGGLRAQSNTKSYEQAFKAGFYSKASCMAYDTLSQWIIAGNYKDTSANGTPAYIMKVDSTGHMLWDSLTVQHAFPNSDHCDINDLIHTADQNFVITGKVYNCPGTVPLGSGFLQKFNRNGNVIWSKNYPAPANHFGLFFNHILELATGRFLIACDTSAYCTQNNGDSIWAHNYTKGLIHCLAQNVKGQLMLGCERGIILLDTLGTVLGSYPFAKPVEGIGQNTDSTYIVMTNHSLIKLTKSLVAIQTFNLRPYLASEARMRQHNGNYWITGKDTVNGGVRVVCLNPALALMHSSSFASKQTVPNDIEVGAKEIAVSGTEYPGSTNTTETNSNGFFKAFNLNAVGGMDTTDAGVIKVSIDSAMRIHPPAYVVTNNDVHFKATVIVKNFGRDTLRSVVLNTYLGMYTPCEDQTWYKLDSCNVPPGDSLVIHPGWLVSKNVNTGTGPFSMPACFWTAVPNARVDKDHSNDEGCTTFGVPMGILEQSLAELVNVYPNPAHDVLTIDLPAPGPARYKLMLYNATGQMITNKIAGNSLSLQLDISNLAPGLYMMEIQDMQSGGCACKKIIIQ